MLAGVGMTALGGALLGGLTFLAAPFVGMAAGRWLAQSWSQGGIGSREAGSVVEIQGRVARRLKGLDGELQRIGKARQRVSEHGGAAHRSAAMDALEAAETATKRMMDHHRVELWRAWMLRWQNGLQPMQQGWADADSTSCERWLDDLQKLRRQGEVQLEQWRQGALAEQSQARRCIDRLVDALDICDALREALVLRQAAAIAEQAPGVADRFDARSAALANERIGRVPQDIGEYRDAASDLEREAERLRLEWLAIDEIEAELG